MCCAGRRGTTTTTRMSKYPPPGFPTSPMGRQSLALDLAPMGGVLPEDTCPAPDQVGPAGDVSEAACETGGPPPPEVATDYQRGVSKFRGAALLLQIEEGRKHVKFPWRRIDPGPVPESRTRGFFFLAAPGYFMAAPGDLSTTAVLGIDNVREMDKAPYVLLLRSAQRRRGAPLRRPKHGVQAEICRTMQLVPKKPRRRPARERRRNAGKSPRMRPLAHGMDPSLRRLSSHRG